MARKNGGPSRHQPRSELLLFHRRRLHRFPTNSLSRRLGELRAISTSTYTSSTSRRHHLPLRSHHRHPLLPATPSPPPASARFPTDSLSRRAGGRLAILTSACASPARSHPYLHHHHLMFPPPHQHPQSNLNPTPPRAILASNYSFLLRTILASNGFLPPRRSPRQLHNIHRIRFPPSHQHPPLHLCNIPILGHCRRRGGIHSFLHLAPIPHPLPSPHRRCWDACVRLPPQSPKSPAAPPPSPSGASPIRRQCVRVYQNIDAGGTHSLNAVGGGGGGELVVHAFGADAGAVQPEAAFLDLLT